MEYTQVIFELADEKAQEALAALLEDFGYEGFEFNADNLGAFIPSDKYLEGELKAFLQSMPDFENTAFGTTIIPETNWNAVWESGYSPLRIGDELYVRATFHPVDTTARYEVIIDPKRSFGTGHHDTTRMMSEMLLENSPAGYEVLDFGSGTGILAILAAKMGATSVLAIDHEEWAYNNCVENIELNNVPNVSTVHGDDSAIPSTTFDIVLANVNKNVILATIERLSQATKQGGIIYLSGLLHEDEQPVLEKAAEHGYEPRGKKAGNNWICLKLTKTAS